nr:GTPase [Wohlfahrtiimonas chitiniclastica]
MTETNYNIAIIGQTGVGKSSLINYLFGDNVAKTGVGKPVTTNGFHEIKHFIKDMPVNIYDSWGWKLVKRTNGRMILMRSLRKEV